LGNDSQGKESRKIGIQDKLQVIAVFWDMLRLHNTPCTVESRRVIWSRDVVFDESSTIFSEREDDSNGNEADGEEPKDAEINEFQYPEPAVANEDSQDQPVALTSFPESNQSLFPSNTLTAPESPEPYVPRYRRQRIPSKRLVEAEQALMIATIHGDKPQTHKFKWLGAMNDEFKSHMENKTRGLIKQSNVLLGFQILDGK
jgi:hypothetical protein